MSAAPVPLRTVAASTRIKPTPRVHPVLQVSTGDHALVGPSDARRKLTSVVHTSRDWRASAAGSVGLMRRMRA
jgi:hypothetical protein